MTHDPPEMVPWPADEDAGWDDAAEPSPEQEVTLARLSSAFAEMLGDEDAEGASPSLAAAAAPGALAGPETGTNGAAAAEPDLAEADLAADDHGEITPRGIFEALLFVGTPDNRPLSIDEITALVRGVTADEVHALVRELNAEYVAEGCPYEISSEGDGFRLALRPAWNAVRDRFYGRLRETRLSQAAVEVLAIVAYHEPITAPKLNELRGGPSGAVLSQLVRRQLLRLEKAGKGEPPRYYTTGRFLDLFGLESLADLPRSQDMA